MRTTGTAVLAGVAPTAACSTEPEVRKREARESLDLALEVNPAFPGGDDARPALAEIEG